MRTSKDLSVLIIIYRRNFGNGHTMSQVQLVLLTFGQILEKIRLLLQYEYCHYGDLIFLSRVDSSNVSMSTGEIWALHHQWEFIDIMTDLSYYMYWYNWPILHQCLSYMLQGWITCDFHRARQLPIQRCDLMFGEGIWLTALENLRQLNQWQSYRTRKYVFSSSLLLRGNRAKKVQSCAFRCFWIWKLPPLGRNQESCICTHQQWSTAWNAEEANQSK